MSNCVDCSCKKVARDKDTCKNLHEQNDSKTRGASRILADTPLCEYKNVFPKIFYSIWCMFKNIIDIICWILSRLDALEAKVNEIIDYLNKLCQALKCVIEYLKKDAEEKLAEALGNVTFNVSGQGSTAGQVYSKVTTQPDGTFDIEWTMAYAGNNIGKGVVNGKVNHVYTPNKEDGSIDGEIPNLTINTITYNGTGTGYSPARFTITDRNGGAIYDKQYNPGVPFVDTLNKEVNLGLKFNIPAKGGTSGDIHLLNTSDQWEIDPTNAKVSASYTNNNEQVKPFDCDIECEMIEKLKEVK